jgi:flagella basal body P-ring formation protein FlgA
VATIALGAIALLVACGSSRINEPSVLVAKSLILRGTPGGVVHSRGLYRISHLAKSSVKTGAFVDPSMLTGKVAVVDIFPGQQLTADDFGPAKNPRR